MSIDPNESNSDKNESQPSDMMDGLIQGQIEIEVDDPTIISDEFDEADFDHDFDDDFEEEIEGEYDLEDDQYGEDFKKEFGHLTDNADSGKKDKKDDTKK